MAESESTLHQGEHLLTDQGNITSFSQLLFSNDDDDGHVVGLDTTPAFHFSSFENPPKMLCFGGYQNESEIIPFCEATRTTPQIYGVTCSDSSSASSGNNNCNSAVNKSVGTISKPNRKRNLPSQVAPVQCNSTIAKTPLPSQRTSKKAKTENLRSTGNAKVRKEKVGDRIAALQQLVSPFGKTDTASVLHEAMGYIRFLQEQVQVLCSPYLQHLPEGGEEESMSTKDLGSKGLCLVPVDCIQHVASSNGADYWSPAAMGNNFSSSKQ